MSQQTTRSSKRLRQKAEEKTTDIGFTLELSKSILRKQAAGQLSQLSSDRVFSSEETNDNSQEDQLRKAREEKALRAKSEKQNASKKSKNKSKSKKKDLKPTRDKLESALDQIEVIDPPSNLSNQHVSFEQIEEVSQSTTNQRSSRQEKSKKRFRNRKIILSEDEDDDVFSGKEEEIEALTQSDAFDD